MTSPPGKVIIADDDEQVRVLCEDFLNRFGYVTHAATDGREVLDLVDKFGPDVVLLDVMMPNVDGLEVCRTLKGRIDTQDIPIILITGMNSPEDIMQGLEAGADDYVCKPLRLPELKVRVDHLVRRKQLLDMLQAQNRELVFALDNQSQAIADLFTLSLQMNLAADLGEMLSVLTNSLSRIMGCRRVSVMLPDKKGLLRIVSSVGIPADVVANTCVPTGSGIAGKVFAQCKPIIVTPDESSQMGRGYFQSLAFASMPIAVAPMIIANEPVGVINLTDRADREQGAFEPGDITVLTHIAQASAVAIKNRLRQSEVRETQDVAIFALAKLAESRDATIGNHLRRVQAYCRKLAEWLQQHSARLCHQITSEFIDELWRAAPLHDIGKVAIADNILLKPAKLTPGEFKAMEQHTIIGGRTLEDAERMLNHKSFLSTARQICYGHHEKWDGTGYPQQLGGELIPLSARILACADVYDALTSIRPYKPAFAHERACAIIRDGRGSHFDPEVYDAFAALAEEFDKVRRHLADDPDELETNSEDFHRR